MEYRVLGRSGLVVSRFCFGTLTLGPLQASLPLREGADLIRKALDLGVNFIDTAELYGTYPYIREALRGRTHEVIIATKSYAFDREGMRESLHTALKELGRDYIDIFLLHQQETTLTLEGHRPALEFLLEAKQDGLVRAVGVSTHTVEVAKAVSWRDEYDVLHPIINYRGLGIQDGTVEEMLAAVADAYKNGKGIYAMKALGGGNLLPNLTRAFDFIRSVPYIHSIAIGVKTPEELEMDLYLLQGEKVPLELEKTVRGQVKRLFIEQWCDGCGTCVEHCHFHALSIVGGRAVVDDTRCTLCGYCSAYCPEFNIKII